MGEVGEVEVDEERLAYETGYGEVGDEGERGDEEPVLFGDWRLIRQGMAGARAEVKFDVAGGRGGKGKDGRTGEVCGCDCPSACGGCLPNPVRLGGPQPGPFPLVCPLGRPCTSGK